MNLKELARTGVRIPEVGIGTWNYHAGPAPLRRGLEAGALFLDTAPSYGTEPLIAEVIKGLRGRVFVATKVSPENFHRADLRKSVDGSLRRLGVDVIDLLQLHAPNPATPIHETMDALGELVDAGKVRFIGVSNFTLHQLREAQAASPRYPIVSNQVRYNICDRTIEGDLLPYCQAQRITVIAYSPLARGLGRIRDCDPHGVIDELVGITGRSAAQIAINWCLSKDGVVAIPKGNSVEHILDNCAAGDWRLTAEQMARLDAHIRYRHRTRFDQLMRRWIPGPLQRAALWSVAHLPAELRRRVT